MGSGNIRGRAVRGTAARLIPLAALVLGLIPGHARADSAPDAGEPFVPRPASKPLYAIKAPEEDPARQRHIVTAADGTEIYTETWLPKAKDGHVPPARIPTVLLYSPYLDKGNHGSSTRSGLELLVPRGYAYTTAHLRGTGASGGCADLNGPKTVDDGARVVEYLGRDAPWSTGVVGMHGLSFPGGTQLLVAALGDKEKTKYLKAIVPSGPVASWYDNNFQDGVPYFLLAEAGVPAYFFQQSLQEMPGDGGTPQHHLEKPGCLPDLLLGSVNVTGDYTSFARERDTRRGTGQITAALLTSHGHADPEVPPLMQAGLFDRLAPSTPRAGVFGVFSHDYPHNHKFAPVVQPDWERPDWLEMTIAWYDRYLKGLDTGVEEWPVAQVQGLDGQWRAEPDWPPTGGPAGHLALAEGGRLKVGTPTGATTYTEGEPENTETGTYAPGTSAVFETDAVPERLQLTGMPVLDAWVSLDRPDAHLAAKLEVFGADGVQVPHGRAVGVRSMQHLEPLVDGRFQQQSGTPPPFGVPVRAALRFQPTDLVIPKGGRLRLTVAGSVIVFEGLDQLQDGAGVLFRGPSQPSGTATRVTIHHDCAHPSALRFLMPRAHPQLLNVREKDEPADQPLADNRPFAPPVSDAGGMATSRVCGSAPIDPATLTGVAE